MGILNMLSLPDGMKEITEAVRMLKLELAEHNIGTGGI